MKSMNYNQFFSSLNYMRLVSVKRTPEEDKEFLAIFERSDGKENRVRFGTKSNYVSNPDKTKEDRKNYIARHKVNEDFNDPMSPGALSRWLLWGESRSIEKNIRAFKKKFGLD